eukprot:SAG31_NODE_7694_length_1615_cov_1.551451_2_plen_422_part_01
MAFLWVGHLNEWLTKSANQPDFFGEVFSPQNLSIWDHFASDADVCCDDAPDSRPSYMVWGACDQGIQYKNAQGVAVANAGGSNGGGANVLAVYDGTLTEFLGSYFAPVERWHRHKTDDTGLPQLFSDVDDAHDPWGLLVPRAGTLKTGSSVSGRRPPSLDYNLGAEVLAVLPVLGVAGKPLRPPAWEVYCANATGWEPLPSKQQIWGQPPHNDNSCGNVSQSTCAVTLLRYITSNFVSYSQPAIVLSYPSDMSAFGTPTLKSLARDDHSGRYVLFAFGAKESHTAVPKAYRGAAVWISTDRGLSWKMSTPTGITLPPNKDDLNLVFDVDRQGKPAFVDMQINMEKMQHRLKYCDNTAGAQCNARRVITAKISHDGVAWGHDFGLRTPDLLDPPELQFYRFRAFHLSGRLFGHALLYAPSPWL